MRRAHARVTQSQPVGIGAEEGEDDVRVPRSRDHHVRHQEVRGVGDDRTSAAARDLRTHPDQKAVTGAERVPRACEEIRIVAELLAIADRGNAAGQRAVADAGQKLLADVGPDLSRRRALPAIEVRPDGGDRAVPFVAEMSADPGWRL